MILTTRPQEICLSTVSGITFGKILEKSEKSYSFQEDEDEQYFIGKITRSILEYKKDKLLVCLKGSPHIFCIDRRTRDVSRKIKIPSGDTNCFCMRLIPDYNADTLPFVMIRDRKAISIVDIKSGNGYVLIESKFNYEPGNTKRLELYR
jgi:hypothetical protein